MKTFQPKIYIDGKDLESLGLKENLFSVEISQDDSMADVAIVNIWNKNRNITDSDIFRERGNLDIWIGTGGPFEFMGRFIIQKPMYGFPEKDAATIKLIAFDESVLLKQKGEKRRVFKNTTDSEIVTQIAAEYSLLSDVETTQERREQVNQLDITDLAFVTKLAKRNGYLLYVKDHTLHFHQLRFEDTRLELIYGDTDGKDNIVDFWPGKTLLSTAGIFTSTILDKNIGTTLTAISTNIPDAFGQQEKIKSPAYRDASAVLTQPPTKYIPSVEGTENIMTLQNLTNRKQQYDSYILSGWGKANGNPKIKARTVVTISGIGHLSGIYYIKSVRHFRDEAEGYITNFYAAKTMMGIQKRLPPSTTGSQAPSNTNPGQSVQPDIIGEVTV